MSEAIPEPDPSLSRDARNSTYEPYQPGEEDDPLAGPGVVQTLGSPEAAPAEKTAKTKRSSG